MRCLEGKVAIVTGAGQGIGRGIALAFARQGAAVAVAGRTESKLMDTVRLIEQAEGLAAAIPCDVSSAEDIARTVERTLAEFGGIDILVNNAYDGVLGPLLSVDDEDS